MSPAIRLGDRDGPRRRDPPEPINRLRRRRVTVGGIETRAIWSHGDGVSAVLLHGWMDNSDTWLEVLDLLAARRRAAIAYDQPGSGVAPPLDPEQGVLDQLVDFGARAVIRAAERSGKPVVLVGNSLGGWTALRLTQHEDLPIAGVVAVGPAGIRMAPLFFTMDRIPAVSRANLAARAGAEGVVRSVAGGLPPARVRRPGGGRSGGRRPVHAIHGGSRGHSDPDRLRQAAGRAGRPVRRRADQGTR